MNENRIAVGLLNNPDNESPMTIWYNGPGEEMTAENDHLVESIGASPESVEDAASVAFDMYGRWPWDYDQYELD